MSMKPDQDRRRLLRSAMAAGLLPWGWPTASLAVAGGANEGNERLVVVMLRGALDGLAAVPVPGDPAWAVLRPTTEAPALRDATALAAPLPLTGPFALHSKLATLHQWFAEGSLLVAHAVASPYRERSHFDAQQLLESGGTRPFELSTGWLGRALQATQRQGVALGAALPLALRGADSATSWLPSAEAPPDADWLDRVARLYGDDPQLAARFRQAREQRLGAMGATGETGGSEMSAGGGNFPALAAQAGRVLAASGGPSVAWLDVNGWDTHTQQVGRLSRLLEGLDTGLAGLRSALGERWSDTAVLVITEFGRSAAMNGSGGTDHGTGGIALLAGGRVAGGRVLADWPGLAATQLLDRRDLRPTLDLRAFVKPVLQRQLGVATAALDRHVLPGAPAGLAGLWRA
jgi:uncharacterized protein (DUF1501 family)